MSGIQLRRNLRDVDAECGELPRTVDCVFVIGEFDTQRLALLAKLQPEVVEEILQRASIGCTGRKRHTGCGRRERRKRALEVVHSVDVARKQRELRVCFGVPPFARVVDDPYELGEKARPIGCRLDPERTGHCDSATGNRDVFRSGGCRRDRQGDQHTDGRRKRRQLHELTLALLLRTSNFELRTSDF